MVCLIISWIISENRKLGFDSFAHFAVELIANLGFLLLVIWGAFSCLIDVVVWNAFFLFLTLDSWFIVLWWSRSICSSWKHTKEDAFQGIAVPRMISRRAWDKILCAGDPSEVILVPGRTRTSPPNHIDLVVQGYAKVSLDADNGVPAKAWMIPPMEWIDTRQWYGIADNNRPLIIGHSDIDNNNTGLIHTLIMSFNYCGLKRAAARDPEVDDALNRLFAFHNGHRFAEVVEGKKKHRSLTTYSH